MLMVQAECLLLCTRCLVCDCSNENENSTSASFFLFSDTLQNTKILTKTTEGVRELTSACSATNPTLRRNRRKKKNKGKKA
jgi:hypothetical protein